MSGGVAAIAGTAIGVLLAITGCSGNESVGPTPPGGGITVFAASSLRSVFPRVAELFQAAHPGTSVRLQFAGSADLVAQLQQGAPADVLATADTASMQGAVADQLLDGSPRDFASNSMMIAVPPGNPARISAFADLADAGVSVVVCAPQVPCGAATLKVEAASGVRLSPVSQESAAADVLGKVTTGQADAGVVYVTDVRAGGSGVMGIAIPDDINAMNTYPVAVLAGSASPQLAREFAELLGQPAGRAVLRDAGFAAPVNR